MKYIVAIDLGTSKIIGMAAQKTENGLIVLAVEKEDNVSSLIKRGYVHNAGELALKIKSIVKKLENRIGGKTIAKVYVNLNGQSLKSVDSSTTYLMKGDETISQELLDKLQNDARKTNLSNGETLDVVDPEYFINNVRELSPVGISCPQIECHYKLIVGKSLFKQNISRCFAAIKDINIAGYIISPLATGVAVLSDKDKELGCALIEFGAGVTTLSVYKNKLLRYLVTIPFGGQNITNDICDLNVLAPYAEKLKIEVGDCSNPSNVEKGKKTRLQSNDLSGDAPEVEVRKLNEYIFARENEILVNIINQLKNSGYNEQLGAGIIIAGGASNMRGLTDLLKGMTNHEIRRADLMIPIDISIDALKKSHAGYEQILGMLWLGNESCIKEIQQATEDKDSGNSEGTQTGGTSGNNTPAGGQTGGTQTTPKKKKIMDRFTSILFPPEDNNEDKFKDN